MSTANSLRAIREDAALTQREVGERADCTPQRISQIERAAEDRLTLAAIVRFLGGCGCTVHFRASRPDGEVVIDREWEPPPDPNPPVTTVDPSAFLRPRPGATE